MGEKDKQEGGGNPLETEKIELSFSQSEFGGGYR